MVTDFKHLVAVEASTLEELTDVLPHDSLAPLVDAYANAVRSHLAQRYEAIIEERVRETVEQRLQRPQPGDAVHAAMLREDGKHTAKLEALRPMLQEALRATSLKRAQLPLRGALRWIEQGLEELL